VIRVVNAVTLFVALFSLAFVQAKNAAPQLVLKDVEGHTLRLSDYKGKVVLLNFWATWCAPCRAEMPDLVKWQREYQGHGLQVIGVTYPPEKLVEVRKFIKSIKVNYPIAIGAKETKALFDKGENLPITVVIDKKGTVRDVIQGVIFPDEFEEEIKPLFH